MADSDNARTQFRISKRNLPIHQQMANDQSSMQTTNQILSRIIAGDFNHLPFPEGNHTVAIHANKKLAQQATIVAKSLGYVRLGDMVDVILENELKKKDS